MLNEVKTMIKILLDDVKSKAISKDEYVEKMSLLCSTYGTDYVGGALVEMTKSGEL